jgi:hypothetical protein
LASNSVRPLNFEQFNATFPVTFLNFILLGEFVLVVYLGICSESSDVNMISAAIGLDFPQLILLTDNAVGHQAVVLHRTSAPFGGTCLSATGFPSDPKDFSNVRS